MSTHRAGPKNAFRKKMQSYQKTNHVLKIDSFHSHRNFELLKHENPMESSLGGQNLRAFLNDLDV